MPASSHPRAGEAGSQRLERYANDVEAPPQPAQGELAHLLGAGPVHGKAIAHRARLVLRARHQNTPAVERPRLPPRQLGPQAHLVADVDPGAKAGFERFVRREPLGVVFVVAAWNYPYLIAVNSVIPAIIAGNAVGWFGTAIKRRLGRDGCG